MKIEFLDGHPFPDCKVHLDQFFPKFYAIQLMRSGSMYFQRGNEPEVDLQIPCFFWTDLTSRYRYGPGPTGSWDHHWISFTGETADTYYLELLQALAPRGYIPVSNARHIRSAFMDLIQSIHVPTDNTERIHLLNRILVRVEENRAIEERVDERILTIKRAIDTSPESEFNFHDLARKNGYSYFHFRRLFRELAGVPVQRYVLARRIQKAAEFLMQTDESIQSIGYRYGYDDPARFSKVFKIHHGLSPREYRRQRKALVGKSRA